MLPTGEAPLDASIGFLPPNNGTTGQGFVTYQIRTKQDVASGAVIDAVASIIFDANEPIDTPPIFNTIDDDRPEVVLSVNDEFDTGSIIELDKFDNSSGVRNVDLYLFSGEADRFPRCSSIYRQFALYYQLIQTACFKSRDSMVFVNVVHFYPRRRVSAGVQ